MASRKFVVTIHFEAQRMDCKKTLKVSGQKIMSFIKQMHGFKKICGNDTF